MADETRIDYAVVCRTCLANVWQGNVAPADGQALLTAFADSVPGPACPSKIATCPHKSAAIAAAQLLKTATQGDLAAVKTRLDKIEAKGGVLPATKP